MKLWKHKFSTVTQCLKVNLLYEYDIYGFHDNEINVMVMTWCSLVGVCHCFRGAVIP